MAAIMRLTYGYGEEIRRVSRAELASMMGISDRSVRGHIAVAKAWGMIVLDGWKMGVQQDHSLWSKPEGRGSGLKSGRAGFRFGENRHTGVPVSDRRGGVPQEPEGRGSAQRHRQETERMHSTSPPSEEPDTGLFAADDLEEPVEKPKREDQILSERLWAAFGEQEPVAEGVFAAVNQWIAQGIDDPSLYAYVEAMEERQPRINSKSKPNVAIPAAIRKDLRYPPRWQKQQGRQASSRPQMLQPNAPRTMDETDPDLWSFRPPKGQTGK